MSWGLSRWAAPRRTRDLPVALQGQLGVGPLEKPRKRSTGSRGDGTHFAWRYPEFHVCFMFFFIFWFLEVMFFYITISKKSEMGVPSFSTFKWNGCRYPVAISSRKPGWLAVTMSRAKSLKPPGGHDLRRRGATLLGCQWCPLVKRLAGEAPDL